MPDLPAAAQDLYGVPLDQFTEVRNDLAKKVSQDGDRATAERIRRLKKPRLSMWALNRVLRDERALAERLLDANERIASADTQSALREATDVRRDVIARIEKEAQRVLEAEGRGGTATTQEIVQTLYAVGADQGRDELLTATFVDPLQASAFGFGLDLRVQPDDAADDAQAAERLREERAAATRELEAAEKRVRGSERAVEQARAAVDRAENELASAQRELSRAQERLDALGG